jgi:hypothetical protein
VLYATVRWASNLLGRNNTVVTGENTWRDLVTAREPVVMKVQHVYSRQLVNITQHSNKNNLLNIYRGHNVEQFSIIMRSN